MSAVLPFPQHFDSIKIAEVRRVSYGEIAAAARIYSQDHALAPASADRVRTGLLAIDCQLTFCHPEFELYVGGRTGTGALDDTRRLVEFIYRNLNLLTAIHATLDTHTANQFFFDQFFIDKDGNHPIPMVTDMSLRALQEGVWHVNPGAVLPGTSVSDLQQHVLHYAAELEAAGKYSLTIWPYHAMLGGIGHALVPSLEEACFFHNQARSSQTCFEMKGGNPLTENYSVLRPEVLTTFDRSAIAHKNSALIDTLLSYDRLFIAGQAKSHCVVWTIEDLLNEINARDPKLARKIYLLEDCTSPVVVPGLVDFTEQADAAFARFAEAGMQIVNSDEID